MDHLIVSALPTDETVEVVERKGMGHPDTICDALAELFSRALCHEYRRRFGAILHYNVDKALLLGGRAIPRFGGGEVVSPINVYLAGRATSDLGAERIPIADATEAPLVVEPAFALAPGANAVVNTATCTAVGTFCPLIGGERTANDSGTFRIEL